MGPVNLSIQSSQLHLDRERKQLLQAGPSSPTCCQQSTAGEPQAGLFTFPFSNVPLSMRECVQCVLAHAREICFWI